MQVNYFKPVIMGILALIPLLPWQLARAAVVSQTTQTTSYVYHYDNNGNLVEADKGKSVQYQYNYNSLNQLVTVTDALNNKTYTYQYYADGRRAAKVDKTANQSIDFYYGQNGKLLNEALTIDQAQTKISSYFAGSRFIKDLQNTNNSQLTESLAVRHNHPASIALKNSVSQIKSYHIDDYGNLTNSNNNTQSNNDNGFDFDQNPYIFGAGYHDSETGLNYQGARYYNPNAQRFVAQDSYDLLNRYNYANGNPVMSYDPSGHYSIKDFGHDVKKYTWGESTGQHVGFVLSLALAPVGGVGYGVVGGAMIGGIATAASVGIDDHFKHLQRDLISIGINAGIGGALGGVTEFGMSGAKRVNSWRKGSAVFRELEGEEMRPLLQNQEPESDISIGETDNLNSSIEAESRFDPRNSPDFSSGRLQGPRRSSLEEEILADIEHLSSDEELQLSESSSEFSLDSLSDDLDELVDTHDADTAFRELKTVARSHRFENNIPYQMPSDFISEPSIFFRQREDFFTDISFYKNDEVRTPHFDWDYA
ncbi:RHS repeat domain-containing protein [Facilibium subflavum]|uniref:RHS repeat domain-containing protein n=1 Tax=Facilibium subflavum TaxID=2219058 RepID=UPI000E646644|nr:RHS repeat-associated core domain-containing protein [Facilibium subflavum]